MKRKLPIYLLVIAYLLSLYSTVLAMPVDPDSPLLPIEMRILPNGLRVIVKEIPSYPIATINVWVDVGAKDDPEGLSGLAHFFEHLIFKGTPSRPRGQMAYAIESVGGYLNAMTSLDYTTYFIVVPSEYAALAMEVQADALLNSLFEQTEIDMERTVIHEEIRLRLDNPQTYLVDMLLQYLFPDTPYARPVIGTFEELANVNHQEMVDFHAAYYVPNNMVLVVAGNVDADQVFAQAEELYGGMPAKAIPQRPYVAVPRLEAVTTLEEERNVNQSYILMGYPAPGANDRDAAALTMAGVILGQGRVSRLYKALIEKEHLVNSISAAYNGFSDIGLFGISAMLEPENLDRVVEIIREELVRLQTEPVTDAELSRAKTLARSSLAFSNQSSSNVAMFLGQKEIYGGVMNAVNQIAILEHITADDIMRAAQTYLNPDAYVLGHLRPEGR
ncbi:MAG: insulinase family protein [Firmicutes bacterium]|nr:insulinase family protein [Bacillota bacterium]